MFTDSFGGISIYDFANNHTRLLMSNSTFVSHVPS